VRILQTIHTYWPQVGGAQIYVHNLSKILIEKGHTVTVFTHKLPETPKREVIEGVNVRRFGVIPWKPYGIPHHRVQPYYQSQLFSPLLAFLISISRVGGLIGFITDFGFL